MDYYIPFIYVVSPTLGANKILNKETWNLRILTIKNMSEWEK